MSNTLAQTGTQQSYLIRSISAHGLLIAIVGFYFIAALVLLPAGEIVSAEALSTTVMLLVGAMLPIALFSVFFVRFYQVARYQRPENPISAVAKDFWQVISDPRKLLVVVPAFLLTAPFFRTYVAFKSAIPDFTPFSWDKTFYEWDNFVHFGNDPWQVIHPFVSQYPWLTSFLSINYVVWFLFLMIIWGLYAFGGKYKAVRTQFLLTFFLVWSVGGSLLAVVFSSVGPAFYAGIGLSPDPYAPLLEYLSQTNKIVPVWSVDIQNTFLGAFQNKNINLGMSAMPSMHNGVALLMTLGAWHINRKFGLVLAVHCFLVYVASFHLAWHYAIDAYAGWVITLGFWYVSGIVARWWHAKAFMREFDAMIDASSAQH